MLSSTHQATVPRMWGWKEKADGEENPAPGKCTMQRPLLEGPPDVLIALNSGLSLIMLTLLCEELEEDTLPCASKANSEPGSMYIITYWWRKNMDRFCIATKFNLSDYIMLPSWNTWELFLSLFHILFKHGCHFPNHAWLGNSTQAYCLVLVDSS